MQKIEAVIFDVGGVLRSPVGKGIHNRAARHLGISLQEYTPAYNTLFPVVSTGRITEEEYWNYMKKQTHAPGSVPDDFFHTEHYASYHPNEPVLRLGQELRQKGVTTALLTNSLPSRAGLDEAGGIYDGFPIRIFSHKVGIRKPKLGVYRLALEGLDLPPERTIFVDDKDGHVAAAKEIGMGGIVYSNPNQLRRDLHELSVL